MPDPQVAAHSIRQAVEKLAEEIGDRCAKESYAEAEQTGMLKDIPPGHDFGRERVRRIAAAVLFDWLLGDLRI